MTKSEINIEIVMYTIILGFLLSALWFTVKQMDGRNDCIMSKLYGFSAEKQAIFCNKGFNND